MVNAETIAALFVQPGGPYYGLPGVIPWPLHAQTELFLEHQPQPDARRYNGPHPVVAHPPCHLWGPFAAINYARYGGEHNKPGNDGGAFASALSSVYRFGGVLEHPARSRAWAAFKIPTPPSKTWHNYAPYLYITDVWQSAYGHRAAKRTRLLYCGTKPPPPLDWSTPKGTHQIGWTDQRGKDHNRPTLGPREASATPPAFRDLLLNLARASRSR